MQATRDRHATWFTRRAREWEATIGTTAETDTWPQLATFRADLEVALAACPGRGRRASGSSGWPRRWPGSATPVVSWPRPRCRWASSSRPPTTNGPTPRPGPRDGWRPGSRRTASADATLAEALLGPFRDADGAPEERRGAVARAFLGHLARARGDLDEAAALYTAARTTHERLGNAEGHRLGRPRPRPAGARRGPDRRGGAAAHRVAGAVRLDRLRLGSRGLCLPARRRRSYAGRAPPTSIGPPRCSPAPCGCTTRSVTGAGSRSASRWWPRWRWRAAPAATAARLVGAAAVGPRASRRPRDRGRGAASGRPRPAPGPHPGRLRPPSANGTPGGRCRPPRC